MLVFLARQKKVSVIFTSKLKNDNKLSLSLSLSLSLKEEEKGEKKKKSKRSDDSYSSENYNNSKIVLRLLNTHTTSCIWSF